MMCDGSFVDPTRAAFDAFKALPRDTPIHMLNLLSFRDIAVYPDGHPCSGNAWSGERAYAEYGEFSGPIFARLGGQIVWRGQMQAMLIGPDDECWDASFIAAYPTSAAFMQMVTDPAYRTAVVHRQAAVKTSRLIRLNPLAETTIGFA